MFAVLALPALAADPLVVPGAFAQREVRTPNRIGVEAGDFIRVGVLTATPNPFRGDNGSIGTSVTAYAPGSSVPEPINFLFSPASPDEFSSSRFRFSPELLGSWTIDIVNPESANSPQRRFTNPLLHADGSIPEKMPFVQDMRISGVGTAVTLRFTSPSPATFDSVVVRIFDRNRLGPNGGATLIYRANVPVGATSHTPPTILNASGDTLQMGGQYTFGVNLQESLPGGGQNRSASYFDFSPLGASSPPEVYLPVSSADSNIYSFSATVQGGETIYIDPEIAVAYEYATGQGDPNFRSVVLPAVGDGRFAIQSHDGQAWSDGGEALAGVPYVFPGAGVSRFRVIGIEASAGLDPRNPLAFVTGLAFTASGRFTGTMTALTSTPDITPPLIEPVVSGAAGAAGWYVGPVTVSWRVTDPQSSIVSPCADTVLTSDTNGTTVSCTATSMGGTATQSILVRIDATPPTVSCSASPNSLWPANQQMRDVVVRIDVADALSGAAGFVLGTVSSDEPGTGDVAGWSLGTPDREGQLRATRAGNGDGRTYTLVYLAKDVAGNSASCTVPVAVAHDRGN